MLGAMVPPIMTTLRQVFEHHGIDHLSASSLNAYVHQPALWVMERLLGRSAPVGAAAHRGAAIETGVTHGLLDLSRAVGECQTVALGEYSALTLFNREEKRFDEMAAVTPTVGQALSILRPFGTPDLVQEKIERSLGDDLVPLIGYLDYGWSEQGLIIDLKTQLRLASEVTPGHARQVSAYVYGTNMVGRICYATPKRVTIYDVDDVTERFAELRHIAIRLGKFLALSRDPEELAGLLVPDPEHWMWNNDIARAHRKEVFGL